MDKAYDFLYAIFRIAQYETLICVIPAEVFKYAE